jgi:hypothetical protein
MKFIQFGLLLGGKQGITLGKGFGLNGRQLTGGGTECSCQLVDDHVSRVWLRGIIQRCPLQGLGFAQRDAGGFSRFKIAIACVF